MRLEPAWASISAKCALTTLLGSSLRTPGSRVVISTPCALSRPLTTWTSLISGTPLRMLGVSARREATIAFVTRFFAPRTSMRPRSGLPPWITMVSEVRPTRAAAFCESLVSEFMG